MVMASMFVDNNNKHLVSGLYNLSFSCWLYGHVNKFKYNLEDFLNHLIYS